MFLLGLGKDSIMGNGEDTPHSLALTSFCERRRRAKQLEQEAKENSALVGSACRFCLNRMCVHVPAQHEIRNEDAKVTVDCKVKGEKVTPARFFCENKKRVIPQSEVARV